MVLIGGRSDPQGVGVPPPGRGPEGSEPAEADLAPTSGDEHGGEPTSGDEHGGDAVDGSARSRTGIWRSPLVPIGGIVVVGIVVAAIVVTTGSSPQKPQTNTNTKSSTTTTTVKAVPMTSFTDAQDGFSISYPTSWQRIPDPERPLVVEDGNTNTAFQVQVYRTDQPITSATSVANIKAFTDLIFGAAKTRIIAQNGITVNKMPGYYYLTVYKQGNQVGANTVEFLFQGRKMSIITFQAFPYTNLTIGLGKLFDQILYSYHSNPNVLGPPLPPPTTTTTTKATTKATTRTTAKAGPKKG